MVISTECQLRWISLFSKSSWIKTNASGLSYELGEMVEKKLMETGILLIKMDTEHFNKGDNFNYIMTLLP